MQRLPPDERAARLDCMAWERMRGAKIRQIARQHRLSKSQVHRLVRHIEILPPPTRYVHKLVPLPGGGYSAVIVVAS